MKRITVYFSFFILVFFLLSCKEEPQDKNGIALMYLSEGDTTKALELLNEAIEESPELEDALINRAKINWKRGNIESALEDYGKVIEINNENITAFKDRGMLWIEIFKYEEAIKDFTRVIELYNQDKDTYYMRGIAYFQMDLLFKACDDWKIAAELGSKKAKEQLEKYCNVDN